jgi:hypothetical protein
MGARSKTTETQQPSNMLTKNESAKNSGHYRLAMVIEATSGRGTVHHATRPIAIDTRLDPDEWASAGLGFDLIFPIDPQTGVAGVTGGTVRPERERRLRQPAKAPE